MSVGFKLLSVSVLIFIWSCPLSGPLSHHISLWECRSAVNKHYLTPELGLQKDISSSLRQARTRKREMTPHLLAYCCSGQNSIRAWECVSLDFILYDGLKKQKRCAHVGTMFCSPAWVFLLAQTSVDMVLHLPVSAAIHPLTYTHTNTHKLKVIMENGSASTLLCYGVQVAVVEHRRLMNNWWRASHYLLAW